MNTRLAELEKELQARLDAIADPVGGGGLLASGRVKGLTIDDAGKVSFTIEAPADAADLFIKTRKEAEMAIRAAPGVTGVTAVLTAHDAKASKSAAAPKASGGAAQVRAIVAVASGKGGVGKSTLAANLACAFSAMGLKAGLLDLDVYGPSAPTLFGVAGVKPRSGPNKTIFPVEAHGLKTMSIGYLVDPDAPMIWRGAMATSAVRQMLDDVQWGALDVLVLDLPPGTGDVQLTLVQRTPLAGAIIVSTPQDMALADVRRALSMFEKTHAPILGVIENMAFFQDQTGERNYIFGQGGARRTAEQTGAPFLGEIPIDVGLRESADSGTPYVAAYPDSALARTFRDIAQAAYENIARFNKPAPAIRVI